LRLFSYEHWAATSLPGRTRPSSRSPDGL